MRISATSALVLNWADPELWKTESATRYFHALDLSEGDQLLRLFDPENQKLHVHVVSGRKFFVLHAALQFLARHRGAQIIVLAAGLAPLSLEIAGRDPSAWVFDVDKYLMPEKAAMANNHSSRVRFVSCDITETELLLSKLRDNGYQEHVPTLLICEGIIYYLETEQLISVLRAFQSDSTHLAGDFCLRPPLVDVRAQEIIRELWDNIMGLVGLDSVQMYSEAELRDVLTSAGYRSITFTNMRDIQHARTGMFAPFDSPDRAWLRCIAAEG